MANDTLYQVMYSDAIKDLAGYQYDDRLTGLVDHTSKTGEAVFHDRISPNDSANLSLMTAGAKYRKDYEAVGTPDIDDWTAIQTPHMAITRDRTISLPYQNEVGHSFRTPDEVGENATNQSHILRQLVGRVKTNRDVRVFEALNADTVNRGKDSASLSAISFPSAQMLTYADGIFDKEVLNDTRAIFEDNYAEGEQICCIITPEMKRVLIENSGDKIHSSDFVNGMHFQKGTLPEIYGVVCIVHPLAGSYSDSNSLTWDSGVAHAFTKSALVYNTFRGLNTALDKAITQRNNTLLYIDEYIDCVRVDDKKVVHIQLGTGS